MSDPEVVCLCGSTRFKQQYVEEYKRLAVEGKVVLSVGCFGHADDVPLTEAQKESLDRTHKAKIDMADRIHVLNVDGYIGDSTADEIRHAHQTDTDVSYYSQQPDDIPDDIRCDGGYRRPSKRESGTMQMGIPRYAWQCTNCEKVWYGVDPENPPRNPCKRCTAESWIRRPQQDISKQEAINTEGR